MEICDNLKNLYLVSSFLSWVGLQVSFSQMDYNFITKGEENITKKYK